MTRLQIVTLLVSILAILLFMVKNRKPSTLPAGEGLLIDKSWLTTTLQPLTPPKDVLPADQTFLTFPEWFLVFSPAEQADYFKTNTSTTFPYMKHVAQLWKGYGVVNQQIKGNFTFNTGYHAMILVIGVSTTVEYAAKALYEMLIGRLSSVTLKQNLTEEDVFHARYMRRYVDFIENRPWYEYNFAQELKSLWTSTPFFGPHFFRKLERRYFLSTELLVKSGYGWLIKLGTKSAYDEALLNTAVGMDQLPEDMTTIPEVRNIKVLSDGTVLADLPRYAAFNPAICKLAGHEVNFREIAGNTSAIMLTVLTREPLPANKDITVLFTQPVITKPGVYRVALVTRVPTLSPVLTSLLQNGLEIEHIYDY